MKLSIIIPHYKEPLQIVDKLLVSIDEQHLINFEAIEVLIVNDCGEPLKAEQLIYKNINPILLQTPQNAGAGVARQYGIENSKGDFITFIDADDCLASPFSIFYIFAVINAKPDTDLIWGQFLEEHIVEENWNLHLHNKDLTFSHAKAYKREFLNKNNLKWHPFLRYNEDSYFNSLVHEYAEKIEFIDHPLVVWCYNDTSTVRSGGLYTFRELPSYIQSVNDICDRLKKNEKAYGMNFLKSLYYIYFELQDDAWEFKRVQEFRPQAISKAKEFYNNFKEVFDLTGTNERLNLYNECRSKFKKPICEKQTWWEFLKELES